MEAYGVFKAVSGKRRKSERMEMRMQRQHLGGRAGRVQR